MSDCDLILITQSDVVEYDVYSSFPVDRLELFKTMVYPRMVRYEGKFRAHLELINRLRDGKYYSDADYPERRTMLNIWNLPGAAGIHLANFFMDSDIRVKVINNIDSEWDQFESAYLGCKKRPLVGISSTFYLSWPQIAKVARPLTKLDPEMEIVLGGAFANAQSSTKGLEESFEKMMRKNGVRFVLHAFNSEYDLRDLILARRNGGDLDGIKNLCRLDGESVRDGAFISTEIEWREPLLTETPANWDKIDMPFLNSTIQIRTASSCPFSCAFCSYPTTAGGWKTLDVDSVRKHLDAVMRIPGIKRIIFIDDTFNVPKNRFRKLLHIFSEYDFEWFSFLRVQYCDDEIVSLMKKSGCVGVYLGIESANDRVLKNMNKQATRDDFCRGLDLLNKYGILSLAAFVIGFPGEDDESIQDNIDFIENYDVTYYSLKEFFYIPNTKVDLERDNYGLTGDGAKWQHDTMDSDRAGEIKIEMFKEIKNSTFIDPDTSLWYFAYLYDQGFDFDTIHTIQTEINTIMASQIDGNFSDDHPAYDRLRTILRPGTA